MLDDQEVSLSINKYFVKGKMLEDQEVSLSLNIFFRLDKGSKISSKNSTHKNSITNAMTRNEGSAVTEKKVFVEAVEEESSGKEEIEGSRKRRERSERRNKATLC